jgi:hypothetical protein
VSSWRPSDNAQLRGATSKRRRPHFADDVVDVGAAERRTAWRGLPPSASSAYRRGVIFGLDYAWGDPGVAALKAAGAKFVCRYLSTPGNSKNLRPDEAHRLREAGIAVVVVFETTADRALGGAAAGKVDATSAAAQAKACGLPDDQPIYFAVDFDARPDQQDAINAYLRAAAGVLGHARVGVYGGYYVVKRALDARVCKYAWQTYAWSGGQWDRRAQLQQFSNGHTVNGVSCDYNHATSSDYGQADPPARRHWNVTYASKRGRATTAKTRHPALWAAAHWRAFRRGSVVIFHRVRT